MPLAQNSSARPLPISCGARRPGAIGLSGRPRLRLTSRTSTEVSLTHIMGPQPGLAGSFVWSGLFTCNLFFIHLACYLARSLLARAALTPAEQPPLAPRPTGQAVVASASQRRRLAISGVASFVAAAAAHASRASFNIARPPRTRPRRRRTGPPSHRPSASSRHGLGSSCGRREAGAHEARPRSDGRQQRG